MPTTAGTTRIVVDPQAAEILRRASATAKAHGQTLGAYLRTRLDLPGGSQSLARQKEAWSGFVAGMSDWANTHLPGGHVVDDSREAMYGDRD